MKYANKAKAEVSRLKEQVKSMRLQIRDLKISSRRSALASRSPGNRSIRSVSSNRSRTSNNRSRASIRTSNSSIRSRSSFGSAQCQQHNVSRGQAKHYFKEHPRKTKTSIRRIKTRKHVKQLKFVHGKSRSTTSWAAGGEIRRRTTAATVDRLAVER